LNGCFIKTFYPMLCYLKLLKAFMVWSSCESWWKGGL
jgi:hypothetical protein